MQKNSTKKMVYAGLFLALGLILPFMTAQIPSIGSRLLPMHIPVLLTGFVCGLPYGLAVGFITPILRSFLFGTPPLFPVAIAMAFELAAYGAITGLIYRVLPKKPWSVYISLLIAMLGGRVVWGIAMYMLLASNGAIFTWAAFIAGAFINAIPGIVLQIIMVPLLVLALERAGFIVRGK
jgi:riboflavin transporter FmnP